MPPATTRPESRPPAVMSARLTDFDQLAACFVNWEGRFEQLSTGPFAAQLRVVRGRSIRLVAFDVNQSVLARGRDASGVFSVHAVTPKNAAGLWQGRRLDPGALVALGPDGGTDHRSARRCSYLGLLVPADTLHRAAVSLRAADPGPIPRTWGVLRPPPNVLSALGRRTDQLLALDAADPNTPAAVDGLEQACLRALADVVFPAAGGAGVGLPMSRRRRLVVRAEEVMRSDLGAALGAADLCRELGVSDRTLRLAFRERHGLGPMAFFKALRLNACRAALKAAAPETRVADVGRRFGFQHLGNFAADYRRAFGERPSGTAGRRLGVIGSPGRPIGGYVSR